MLFLTTLRVLPETKALLPHILSRLQRLLLLTNQPVDPPQEYSPSLVPEDKGGSQSFRQIKKARPDDMIAEDLPSVQSPYSNATLEDLLREVDLLELPDFATPMRSPTVAPKILRILILFPIPTQSTESLDPVQIVESKVLSQRPEDRKPTEIGQYTVLGERIDEEMKAKILEAIMQTRHASGGTNQPWVTNSVFKANSYCNRVLEPIERSSPQTLPQRHIALADRNA